MASYGTHCRELRPEAKIKPGVKGGGVAIEAIRGGSQSKVSGPGIKSTASGLAHLLWVLENVAQLL